MGKQNKKLNSHKFTLRQFIWNGFNLTVAVSFLGSLYLLADAGKDNTGTKLGWHMIWIFALMSIIVAICAFAFAKLSRYHKQDNNGGAYIYTRGAFGKFIGFLVGTLNYVIVPMVFSNQILMFIKANFDKSFSVPANNSVVGWSDANAWWSNWTTHLGSWGNLFYDAVGVLLVVGFSLFAFFGSKLYKKAGKATLFIKWITSGFFILFAIIAIFLPATSGSGMSGATNAKSWTSNSHFSFDGFAKAFTACFYYFTGFEVFATAGENLEEPEKNLSKGIIWVVVLSGLFYTGLTTIYMLAVAQGNTTQNINTGFWAILYNQQSWLKWLLWAGPAIMIVSTIVMRGNTVAQMSLYGGTTLQPLSKEGYISNKFSELNSHLFPMQAMKLNVIIVGITISLWMLIPDVINGALGFKIAADGSKVLQADFINVNTIISAASAFYILIYLFVMFALLKYAFAKAIRTNVFEILMYLFAIIVLFVIFIYHYYDLIDTALVNQSIESYVALTVEIVFLVAIVLFIILTYYLYYKPRLLERLKTTPRTQTELDYQFRLLDGWKYLKGKYTYVFNRYVRKQERRHRFDRYFSKFVRVNKDNVDEKFAWKKHIFMEKMNDKIMFKYLIYSGHVSHYNDIHNIDTKQEIAQNNKDARKLFSTQKRIISKLK